MPLQLPSVPVARRRRARIRVVAALLASMLAPATRRLPAQPAGAARATSEVADAATIVRRVAEEMRRRYVLPDVGRRVEAQLDSALRAGAYRHARADSALAAQLTRALRAATADGHMRVEFSAAPLPVEDRAAAAEMERRDRVRYYGPRLNYGVRGVALLPDNVGYLDLSVFAPIDWAGPTITAAMTLLANADALVVDLRDNGGGFGETVQWLASYLVPGPPQPLSGEYTRARDSTTTVHTLPYVPGPRFGAAKPVYVLTARRTFSAAEAFAYDLQALKRATIVGERTGGGAHPYEDVRLGPHFILGLPVARSINPITGRNWQGTGVVPDVVVPPDSALAAALRLAAERRGRR